MNEKLKDKLSREDFERLLVGKRTPMENGSFIIKGLRDYIKGLDVNEMGFVNAAIEKLLANDEALRQEAKGLLEWGNTPQKTIMDGVLKEQAKDEEIKKLMDRIDFDNERVDEIERLNEWINDLQSGMYVNCVYCGHRYGPKEDTPVAMADILKEHIEKCPKHPMSEMKNKLDVILEIVRDAVVHNHHNQYLEEIERVFNE